MLQPGQPHTSETSAPAQLPLTAALAEAVGCMLADVRGIAVQQLALLALETRKAGRDALTLSVLGAIGGLLLAVAWIGLTVACGLWMLEQGVRTSLAVLLASGLNFLAACLALWALRRLWRVPQFLATRTSLGLSTSGSPEMVP